MKINSKLFIITVLSIFTLSAGEALSANPGGTGASTPRKAGLMTFKLNGSQYTADLFEEVNPYSYRILCGNKNYELQIEWKYVSSPSDIRVNVFDLTERGNDVTIRYINFDVPYNISTRSGIVVVNSNNGNSVTGLFSFKAFAENNAGSSNNFFSFTDGTFEITYPAQ